MNNFYLICPIGLESQLLSEIEYKWPVHFYNAGFPKIEIHKGGIEINCLLHEGLLLNNILKTPTKILLRLKTQKCRDIPKLYNIFKKFPWKDYLNQEIVNINVTAKKSRLIHTDKVKAAALDGMKDYFQANKIKVKELDKHKDDPTQSIYIRLNNDDLTISLDTSGELLHIRGGDTYRGKASIRENFASLLLWSLLKDLPNKQYNLIDPMCGTGTFLKEAKNQFKLARRSFNYQFLSNSLIKELPELSNIKNTWDFNYYGFDSDAEVISHLNDKEIQYETKDLFKTDSFSSNSLENIVIINPPYGKRVKIDENKNEYFKRIISSIERVYRPVRLGIIVPTPYERHLKGQKLYFKQNGIDVCFVSLSKY